MVAHDLGIGERLCETSTVNVQDHSMHHFTCSCTLRVRTIKLRLPGDRNLVPIYWLLKVSRFGQRAVKI